MNYLTLEDIKYQIRYEQTYTDEDTFLETLGDSAEQFLEDYLDTPLDDIAAENSGVLPKSLYQALLILVSYLLDNDGSGENRDVPQAFFILTKLYKRYTVA